MRKGPLPQTDEEWIATHFKQEGQCLVWTGYVRPDGYARTKRNRRFVYVHRYAWEMSRGPIPEGLTVDHLCRNRACINLHHLELVTLGENARRGLSHQRQKTHCPQGHPYAGDNLIWVRRRDPNRSDQESRQCHTCKLEAKKRLRQRAKERQAS